MPRKIRDRGDALACLSEWRRRGDDLGTWSRAHDIDGRSLSCWRLNLEGGRAGLGTCGSAELVELVPTERLRPVARYTVRVEGVEIEVGDDFEAATLERILGVVAAC